MEQNQQPLKLNKKYNPQIDENLQSAINGYAEVISYADEIISVEENQGWKRIKELLAEQVDEAKKKLTQFSGGNGSLLTNDEIRFLLKQQNDFEYVLNIVETVRLKKADAEREKAKAEMELNERRKTFGAANP